MVGWVKFHGSSGSYYGFLVGLMVEEDAQRMGRRFSKKRCL